MKKLFLFFILLIFLLGGALLFKERLFTFYLSKELKTKVTLESLSWNSKEGFILKNLTIYNPPEAKTEKALSVSFFSMDIPLNILWKKNATISLIRLKNAFLGVEYFDTKEEESNWSYFFSQEDLHKKGKKSLFIKTLLLENLTVSVTPFDKETQIYPVIKNLEITDISTGEFPIAEIEHAILKEVLKSALLSLGIKPLLKTLKAVPKLIPIPFFPKKEKHPNSRKDLPS